MDPDQKVCYLAKFNYDPIYEPTAITKVQPKLVNEIRIETEQKKSVPFETPEIKSAEDFAKLKDIDDKIKKALAPYLEQLENGTNVTDKNSV